MIIIKGEGKRIDYMIKEYRKKIRNIGMMSELRDRKEYKKKTTRKRENLKNAIYKNKLNGSR
jgi:small subunit ribosomal protein S21